jgi:hypothetical protein
MSETVDGFYAAYMSSKVGQGFAMLVLKHGIVVGSDTNGVLLDGKYDHAANSQISISLTVGLPPNTPLLQGGMAGPDVKFNISGDVENQPIVRIETKHGVHRLRHRRRGCAANWRDRALLRRPLRHR